MPSNLSNQVHGDIDRQLQPLYRTWGNFRALIVRYFPALLWPLSSGTAAREERAGRWAIDWTPQQEKEEGEPFSFSLTGMGFIL